MASGLVNEGPGTSSGPAHASPGNPWGEGVALVTGGGGMLGRAITGLLGPRAVSLAHADLDISDRQAVASALERVRLGMLINCAAANDVDRCETDHRYAEAANVEGPRILAEACGARRIGLVHVSTDYVFDGATSTRYGEDDAPNPVNYYGRSKLLGEEAVLAAAPDMPASLIVRTAWVYGPGGPDTTNFPLKVLDWARRSGRLRIAGDQWSSPTYAPFLARGILELVAAGAQGVYHLAGEGCVSRLEFAQQVIAATGLEVTVEAARTADFPSPAPRPRRTCLDCPRAAALGVRLPVWKEGIRRYAGELLGEGTGPVDNGESSPMTV